MSPSCRSTSGRSILAEFFRTLCWEPLPPCRLRRTWRWPPAAERAAAYAGELPKQSGRTISGGQRQALTLLMATLIKPQLLLLDEHTAALDPKTAAKVLDATDRLVAKDHLTTLMITHNMKDAISHGNRLIMMYEGRIVIDVSGEEKKKLTVPQLLELFSKVSGSDEADDKLLLS